MKRFIIIQTIGKLLTVVALVSALFAMPHSHYTVLKSFVFVIQGALILHMLNDKPNDHSLTIGGCLFIAMIYNPIMNANYHRTDWIILDLTIATAITITISKQVINYIKLKRQLDSKKNKLHSSLHEEINDNGSLGLF